MNRSLRRIFLLLVIVGIGLLFARFLNDNRDTTHLEFWVWRTKEISLGALVLIVFLFGVGLATLLSLSGIISKSMEASRLRRENKALQKLVSSSPAAAPTVNVDSYSISSK